VKAAAAAAAAEYMIQRNTPLRVLPVGDNPSQQHVKSLLPPGAYVWPDRVEERWRVVLPPNPSSQRRWDVGNARIAARLILQDIWKLFCDTEGVDRSQIDIKDLWKDPFEAAGQVVVPGLAPGGGEDPAAEAAAAS